MKDSGHRRLRVFFDPEYYDIFEVINNGKSTNKTSQGSGNQINAAAAIRSTLRIKNSLGLIGNNYKIQIINVDRQLSKMINIDIADLSGDPIDIPLNEATLTSLPNISAASTS